MALLTPLSSEQRQELLLLKNRKDTHPKTRERVEMVLLADAGWSNAQIAAHLGRSRDHVQDRVRDYQTKGIESLGVNYGPRRRRKVTAEYLELLRGFLDDEERTWTSPQLCEALAERTGIILHVDHLREVIRSEGFSWKRTKRSVAHSRKPEVFEERAERLRSLKKISRTWRV